MFSLQMAMLSEGAKERVNSILSLAKTAFHWGFMPTILYLGFQKGRIPPRICFQDLFLVFVPARRGAGDAGAVGGLAALGLVIL